MVGARKIAALGALLLGALLLGAPTVVSATAPAPGLRLIKTSEEDAGTWMSEADKFTRFISKRIGFVDITDTMDLEDNRSLRRKASNMRRANSTMYPSDAEHVAEAKPIIANCDQANLEDWAKEMTDMYNRYYLGPYAQSSAKWMYNTTLAVAAANPKITVQQWEHSYDQPSVIATIPGDNKAKVIVSAHFDSVDDSSNGKGRAPGADDNASGIVVVLEALRVLAEASWAPKNTLEFHFYSGEEGGTLGSRDIFQAYADEGAEVLAMMNQDMTGYSPNDVIAVFTDYGDPNLIKYMQLLVPVYSSLPLSTDECGYGCSDHVSAYDAGYPAVYVCDENMEDASPYIHSPDDTYDTLDFAHILEHTKYTVGFLVEGSYF